MSGCPVPKPIFWCNNLKFLRKKSWYKVVQNLYHTNFYIKIFFGDLEKGVFESYLNLIVSEKLYF